MKRILAKLVSNAIQGLTNRGKISIKVKRKEDKALLTVEDTGQGISPEVRDKMFMPLVTTKAKGQGFGLAVVKKLTEALSLLMEPRLLFVFKVTDQNTSSKKVSL